MSITEPSLPVSSDTAWRIASRYSDVLASETRDLAAAIDDALKPQWRPIDEFAMPEMTKANFYDRHRMLFQMGRRGDTLPWVCEGYAQLALTGKRPNQRAVTRFYGAAGQWLSDGVEFFMPLPEPRT